MLALIVSGTLEPGQRVSEQALSRQLRIGRTPVREAIRQLVAEGIMEQIPRYGTLVKKQDLRDVVEVFEVREAMESFAVYNATPKLQVRDLEILQKLYRVIEDVARQVRKDPRKAADKELTRRIVEADQAFHLHLIHAAGNRRIIKIMMETQVLARAFMGKVAQQSTELIENAYQDHQALWQALKKGDGKEARDIMIRHIRRSRQEAVDYFERIGNERSGKLPEWPPYLEDLRK
jgi:DNA-binding GntR family transcriptional regulator